MWIFVSTIIRNRSDGNRFVTFRGRNIAEGKNCFVKYDITRDINSFRGNIVNSITLLTMRIANKNSWSSSFIELMFDVHVFSKTQATKRTKRRINRDRSKKNLMW